MTALTNKEQLGYVMETTWGTTPASAMQLVRYKKVDDKPAIQHIKSEEITNSREIAGWIPVAAEGGMEFEYELSYGSFDDFLSSLFANAWVLNSPGAGSDTLTVGSTRKSMTIERQLTDIAQYLTYKGAIVTDMTINCAVGKALDGKATLVSQSPGAPTGTSAGTGAPTAVNTNAIMDPIGSIQLAQEGGAGSIAGVTDFAIELSNTAIKQQQVGSLNLLDLNPGMIEAKGAFSCYLADATYLNKFLNRTVTSLAFTIGGASNKKYALTFSNVRLTNVDIPNQGMNNAIVQKVAWQAAKDPTNTTVKIVRTN